MLLNVAGDSCRTGTSLFAGAAREAVVIEVT